MTTFFSARWLTGIRLLAFMLACALVSRSALAQVTLNLKDADIGTLIATVSEVTGKNFIVDPRVKGKVTVISASPMDPAGVYETFLSVLQVQGFAAVPSGDAIKIVPETNVRQEGSGYTSASGRAIDEIVTQVYNIQNVSAVQLVPILRPLVPQWGALAAYAPSNMLIISDRAANVARIEKLIRQIDQSSDREIEMVKLQFASAADVVRTMTSLSQGERQGAGGENATQAAMVIADERSNSVLVGGDRSERGKLLNIIARLDIPVGEEGGTQVQYLNYADAENLAPILEGYAQQLSEGARGPGAAAGPQAAASAGGGANGIKVLADKDTNALIITAPPKLMRQIRDVVAQLDIRRRQVLVESIIAEVSASKSSQIGVDWAVFNGDRVAAAGILNPDTLSGLASALSNGTAGAAGALGQGVNIAGGVDGGDGGTSWAVLLKALKGDGDSNVLSTPSVTTMDNEEANFSVGQEVPFLTGSFSNTGTGSTNSSVNPFQTINRQEVGLSLKITPQINEGSSIKMKIELEVSSLASAVTGAVDLVTNKRTLTNTVMVENGQILVLGGLIDDNVNDTRRSVPLLGDIPLLGSLFRYRSLSREKRNLMVFIRPAILANQVQGDYYTRRKYDSLRQQQAEALSGAVPIIGGSRPILRTFDEYAADQGPPETPASTTRGVDPTVQPEAGPAQ